VPLYPLDAPVCELCPRVRPGCGPPVQSSSSPASVAPASGQPSPPPGDANRLPPDQRRRNRDPLPALRLLPRPLRHPHRSLVTRHPAAFDGPVHPPGLLPPRRSLDAASLGSRRRRRISGYARMLGAGCSADTLQTSSKLAGFLQNKGKKPIQTNRP